MTDETTDVREDVSLTDGPLESPDLWARVTATHIDKRNRILDGFALSWGRPTEDADEPPSGVRSSIYVDLAVDYVDNRYDADDYADGTPVGILVMDTDAREAVFYGLGDIVAAHYEGEGVQGKAVGIHRSGDIRLRGIGAVDVSPEDLIEVTDRVEYHE